MDICRHPPGECRIAIRLHPFAFDGEGKGVPGTAWGCGDQPFEVDLGIFRKDGPRGKFIDPGGGNPSGSRQRIGGDDLNVHPVGQPRTHLRGKRKRHGHTSPAGQRTKPESGRGLSPRQIEAVGSLRRGAETCGDLDILAIGGELADRFGPLPPPVENLIYQLRVKVRAPKAGAEGLASEGSQIVITLPAALSETDQGYLTALLAPGARVSKNKIWLRKAESEAEWKSLVLEVLEKVAANQASLIGN